MADIKIPPCYNKTLIAAVEIKFFVVRNFAWSASFCFAVKI